MFHANYTVDSRKQNIEFYTVLVVWRPMHPWRGKCGTVSAAARCGDAPHQTHAAPFD